MTVAILSDRILTTLEQLGTECPLEEVVDVCPDITWNQIFLGHRSLKPCGAGSYEAGCREDILGPVYTRLLHPCASRSAASELGGF